MSPACWLYRRRLDAYHDGELGARPRARVAAHLAGCEACRRELAGLDRLRGALVGEPFDLPERTWEAFWPQVRARLAVADPGSRPGWQRLWVGGERHRLVLAPALAAVALAVLAVLAPWQRAPRAPSLPGAPTGPAPVTVALDPAALDHVVIQSIETADPETPVMVYSSPDSDVTVLWVFGLERTGV